MTVLQSYSGKYIDLCVLETGNLPGPDSVTVGIEGSGSVIAGPYKVVQKALKFLMTEKGTVPSDPNYGTRFVGLLMSGQIQTSIDLSFAFYDERFEIVNYAQSSARNISDDETLTNMTLESFSASEDAATMKIKFTFVDSSVILAPVQISTV